MSAFPIPGKIYLADDRGFFENEIHRRYSTFNFAEYQFEHKAPFGRLHTFNDEILPAGSTLKQEATLNGYTLLIPITGKIEIRYHEQDFEAEAGEVLLVPVPIGVTLEISNPYPSDWVNFLQAEIQANDLSANRIVQTFGFDFEHTVNRMVGVIPQSTDLPFSLHIGRFGGREEMLHVLEGHHTLFAFVIGGAFELQNRLLHERDGLALWEVAEVDAEALSNGAVLLLLDLNT